MVQHYERIPTKIHKHTNPDMETIVFGDGPAVTRKLLRAEINGDEIEGIYLYQPEKKDSPSPRKKNSIMKMGGVGTIGHFYTEEAILHAQQGEDDFVTFVPNLKQSLATQLFDPRHRKDVYLRHAQNGLKVARAVMAATDTKQVRVSAHSYGGVTTPPFITAFPDLIESVVEQDPSGLHNHNLQPKKLWNNELKKLPGYFIARREIMPPKTLRYAAGRFTNSPIVAGREVAGLYHPDMSDSLIRADELGKPMALLLVGQSAIFDTIEARKAAEALGVFKAIAELPDAGHIAPITDAPDVVPAQIALFNKMAFDQAA